MAAPYRDFWIIVGMTVAVVVFANGTSKTKSGASPEISDHSQTVDDSLSRSAGTNTPETSTKVGATPPVGQASNGETKAEIEVFPNREVRNIEPDFRKAFDDAVQMSLANSPVVNFGQSVDERTDTPATVPSLETKEVRSTPTVFDIQKVDPEADPVIKIGIGTGKTTTNLNVREGPGPKYILLDTLGSGVSLVILAEENGWVHVRVSETGREGWVNKTFLTRD